MQTFYRENDVLRRNFSSLKQINLGSNKLEKIEDMAFGQILMTPMEKIILSDNNIKSLGNNLGLIDNPDTEVDLSSNKISYLLGMFRISEFDFYIVCVESEFKPYVETRRSKGRLVMTGNPLVCGCDVKWLLNSNFQWDNLLHGSVCSSGTDLRTVII